MACRGAQTMGNYSYSDWIYQAYTRKQCWCWPSILLSDWIYQAYTRKQCWCWPSILLSDWIYQAYTRKQCWCWPSILLSAGPKPFQREPESWTANWERATLNTSLKTTSGTTISDVFTHARTHTLYIWRESVPMKRKELDLATRDRNALFLMNHIIIYIRITMLVPE